MLTPIDFCQSQISELVFLELILFLALILYEIIRATGMDLLKLAGNTRTKAG